jgi:hypothetical protein
MNRGPNGMLTRGCASRARRHGGHRERAGCMDQGADWNKKQYIAPCYTQPLVIHSPLLYTAPCYTQPLVIHNPLLYTTYCYTQPLVIHSPLLLAGRGWIVPLSFSAKKSTFFNVGRGVGTRRTNLSFSAKIFTFFNLWVGLGKDGREIGG